MRRLSSLETKASTTFWLAAIVVLALPIAARSSLRISRRVLLAVSDGPVRKSSSFSLALISEACFSTDCRAISRGRLSASVTMVRSGRSPRISKLFSTEPIRRRKNSASRAAGFWAASDF